MSVCVCGCVCVIVGVFRGFCSLKISALLLLMPESIGKIQPEAFVDSSV